ncbi:MAG TPA: O-antigen ligase family protein [Solirubrobacteraceae bacterium]|nr:O-antigen ligase family protein [Solirubrobacteraceae bacterium]
MSVAPAEPAPAARSARPAGGASASRVAASAAAAIDRRGLWLATLLVAAISCFVTFYAKGGLNLESMTTTEMALTLLGGAVAAVAILRLPGERGHGLWPVGIMLAFTALTAVSLVWSVQPDDSWRDAGRMLAYSGVFAAAVALVRLAPGRWPAVLGGLALASVVVCAYALLTKMFPGSLVPADKYARLEAPYGYWNAVGLTAAMGAICCLWLGARRSGHALLSALSYPAMGVLLLTLLLAYSRGALVALAVGLLAWFCLVPLRLRSAAVLGLGALGALAVAGWDFSTHALSEEHIPLSEQISAGRQLGVMVVAMVLALTLLGVAIGFWASTRPPSRALRSQVGGALLALIAIALIAFAGVLAHSQRGLTGSISHTVDALTNPNAKVPPNTPGRLTAVASVRARYWKEALDVFDAHPALGSGAEGFATAHLRYRHERLEVRHAHGFVVQTLADLGLVGLLLALALLAVWLAAAGRATRPFKPREPYAPERIGMLAMLCLVVVFGVHSLVDWTWYVPGDACVALLCAGWLAGRGPLAGSPSTLAVRPTGRPSRQRQALAGTAIVFALLAAWSQWQPQRSEEAGVRAEALLARDHAGALKEANNAVARNPLSIEALSTLAAVQGATGHAPLARATLARAVRLQPSNPRSWLNLGRHDLTSNPRAALHELQAAIYLNPESISPEELAPPYPNPESVAIYNNYVQALRASAQPTAPVKSASEPLAQVEAAERLAAQQRSQRQLRESQTPRPIR